MVTIDTRILRRRVEMLQEIGLPIITWAVKHTLVIVLMLRFFGIIDNGVFKSGKLQIEIKSFFCGEIGDYRIRLWSAPMYNDCSRWSLKVARV